MAKFSFYGSVAERARTSAYQNYLKQFGQKQQPAIDEYNRQMAARQAAEQQNRASFESRYGTQNRPYGARGTASSEYSAAYTTPMPKQTWERPQAFETFYEVDPTILTPAVQKAIGRTSPLFLSQDAPWWQRRFRPRGPSGPRQPIRSGPMEVFGYSP